uniref:Glycoside hydrolase family 42 N-terminal domain-containing protein n=1 Tax=Magnetococcus massalia (strain MO-1) TaxID=451514 RepID=A0A1S7LLG0_MAGMO|nr:conserved exported protein of unknown function [Candidatus Magnetococcus massalia]
MSRFVRPYTLLAWLLLSLVISPLSTQAAEFAREPTKILAFYNGEAEEGYILAPPHAQAELPLNHLGLTVIHRAVQDPLPSMEELKDVRGILIWFDHVRMEDPAAFLRWCIRAMKAGKRLVHMGPVVFNTDHRNRPTPKRLLKAFWNMLGLNTEQDWISNTHNTSLKIHGNRFFPYERDFSGVLPEYQPMFKVRRDVKPLLSAKARTGREESGHILAATTKNGGYVSDRYAFFSSFEEVSFRQWYMNPFRFFEEVFVTYNLPKGDSNTVSNRRAYYSHIDGDAWRSETRIKTFKKKGLLYVSDVILKEVVERFPDLPLTIAPVVADLDPEWFGNTTFIQIARKIFNHPHIEAGTHTLSHPLQWSFFENYDPEMEVPFLHLYPKRHEKNMVDYLLRSAGLRKNQAIATPDSQGWKHIASKAIKDQQKQKKKDAIRKLASHYDRPRAFAVKPFSLHDEIQGSVNFVNQFLQKGRKVEVTQWPGNCTPFEAAVRATRKAKTRNVNGGDTRFDPEYPSIAWVSPLGRYVGDEIQVYASASNENTYTDLWTDRFFGFMHLVETARNTETPVRLKPYNIYYHMYSGERLASLNALLHTLKYARSQELAPVTTSQFAAMVDGVLSAQVYRASDNHWRIENHGDMATVRFDRATLKQVDMARSKGVIGQRHYQGSLYVALDRSKPKPEILLKPYDAPHKRPESNTPYLVDARWWLWNLERKRDQLTFQARGFGQGEMRWKMPEPGSYRVIMTGGAPSISFSDRRKWAKTGKRKPFTFVTDTKKDGLLHFSLPSFAIDGVQVEIRRHVVDRPDEIAPRRRPVEQGGEA